VFTMLPVCSLWAGTCAPTVARLHRYQRSSIATPGASEMDSRLLRPSVDIEPESWDGGGTGLDLGSFRSLPGGLARDLGE
jgi:hypothetical protein